MIVLKILGAIILGIILVLCIPVSVCAQFDKTFEVKIKYLFLTFTVILHFFLFFLKSVKKKSKNLLKAN